MHELKAGDLLLSNRYMNVWDKPADTFCSIIVDRIEEKQTIIIIETCKKKDDDIDTVEIKILTCAGVVGWITAQKSDEPWVKLSERTFR